VAAKPGVKGRFRERGEKMLEGVAGKKKGKWPIGYKVVVGTGGSRPRGSRRAFKSARGRLLKHTAEPCRGSDMPAEETGGCRCRGTGSIKGRSLMMSRKEREGGPLREEGLLQKQTLL